MFTLNLPVSRSVRYVFIVFVLLIVLLYPTSAAQAANFTAGDYTALSNAISTANSNGEADVITLTADITLTGALPVINSRITIEGAGYTLDGNNTYRLLNVTTGGNLTVNHLTLANGYSSGSHGGGITNAATLTVNNCFFSGNTATGANGGAVANTASSSMATVNYSTFTGNSGNRGGAIVNINSNSIALINNSTFTGNSSTAADGGAIFNDGMMTVNNSTFSGNSATTYGGALLNAEILTVINSTITGNTAGPRGGGIYNTSALTIFRNIISGNAAAAGAEIYVMGVSSPNTSYNVLGHSGLTSNQAFYSFTPAATDYNATSNNGNTPLASILTATLADNGGPTQTHALPSGSPAIDRALSDDCAIDQRGAARNYNGSGSAGDYECDSGAYELRESITNGTCGGSTLDGDLLFAFTSGRTISITVDTADSFTCIAVEEMAAPHLLGTPRIQLTNGWWRITGDSSTFDVNMTFPAYFKPNTGDTICRYTGPGTTWDCGADRFTETTITRENVTAFSDWAIYEDESPTAVSLASFAAHSSLPWVAAGLALSLLAVSGLVTLWQVKTRKRSPR